MSPTGNPAIVHLIQKEIKKLKWQTANLETVLGIMQRRAAPKVTMQKVTRVSTVKGVKGKKPHWTQTPKGRLIMAKRVRDYHRKKRLLAAKGEE